MPSSIPHLSFSFWHFGEVPTELQTQEQAGAAGIIAQAKQVGIYDFLCLLPNEGDLLCIVKYTYEEESISMIVQKPHTSRS